MAPIGSGDVTEMVDSTSAVLLAEIQQKRERITWWPIAGGLTIVSVVAFSATQPSLWLSVPVILLFAIITIFAQQYDQLKKSVVLMYDLDGSSLQSYEHLHDAVNMLSQCGASWHVTAKGDVYDPKYHAGAGSLVNRKRLYPSQKNPPYVKTNLSVPYLPFGDKSLYLLPDRILFYAPNGVGAVDYGSLTLTARTTRFIEESSVPHDAEIVDHTWRFVNKNGSPDRRFNSNRQIPICNYDELSISSPTGVQETIQISRLGISDVISFAISRASAEIQSAKSLNTSLANRGQSRPSQMKSEAPVSHPSNPASNSPIPRGVSRAIFEILCCVMVADGRASRTERAAIVDVMSFDRTGWSESECNREMDEFIDRIKRDGHALVVQESLEELPAIKNLGHEQLLLQAIKMVGLKDGKISERERKFREYVRRRLARITQDEA